MATTKPKRMMLGGMAAGVASKALSATKPPAAKAGSMQKQFMSDALQGKKLSAGPATKPPIVKPGSSSAPRPAPTSIPRGALGGNKPPAGAVPAYAKPYVAAQSKSQMPSPLANAAKAFNAQKSGIMGRGPQSAMKKGGAVKKAAKK